jgi:hypothetical protein
MSPANSKGTINQTDLLKFLKPYVSWTQKLLGFLVEKFVNLLQNFIEYLPP